MTWALVSVELQPLAMWTSLPVGRLHVGTVLCCTCTWLCCRCWSLGHRCVWGLLGVQLLLRHLGTARLLWSCSWLQTPAQLLLCGVGMGQPGPCAHALGYWTPAAAGDTSWRPLVLSSYCCMMCLQASLVMHTCPGVLLNWGTDRWRTMHLQQSAVCCSQADAC